MRQNNTTRHTCKRRKLLQFGVNSSLEAFHGRLHLYCLITPCPLLCCDSWWRWNRFSSVTLSLLGFLTALVNSGVATLTVTMHLEEPFWDNQQKVIVAQWSPCGKCPLSRQLNFQRQKRERLDLCFFARNFSSWKKCKKPSVSRKQQPDSCFFSRTLSDLYFKYICVKYLIFGISWFLSHTFGFAE